MGRLTRPAPLIAAAPSRIAVNRDPHGHSPAAEPWRQWYGTQRWKRLRRAVLVRDGFTCQCGCDVVANASELVADHKTPHRGDPRLFWDPENIQTLRKSPCHDAHKQAQERGQAAPGAPIGGRG